jgi:hypothetical protein
MDLWVLGSGEAISIYEKEVKELKSKDTLALQACFPHIYLNYGVIPTYWTWGDPNGSIEGLNYLNSLTAKELSKFKDMKILVPSHCNSSLKEFREYAGSTPLERQHIRHSHGAIEYAAGWKNYKFLLKEIEDRGLSVQVINTTTTKYIKNNPDSEPLLKNKKWLQERFGERFKVNKAIFGTCEFDSESVIGNKFIWGLENKLSSIMFPMAQKLGAKKVFVLGFDHVGGRFYKTGDGRHPWNDETQKKELDEVVAIPLKMVKIWADQKTSHNMKIYNVVEEPYTFLNRVLEYKKFDIALKETK